MALHTRLIAPLVTALLLTGCGGGIPTRYADDRLVALNTDERFLVDHQVRDARYQDIDGLPHIKVDYPLRLRIPEYDQQPGMAEKKSFIRGFLQQGAALSNRYAESAVRHIPRDEVDRFNQSTFGDSTPADSEPYGLFFDAYQRSTQQKLTAELEKLEQLPSAEAVDQYWQRLVENIDESIMTKGRAKRMWETALMVPFTKGWVQYHAMTDDRGPHVPKFDATRVYSPPPGTWNAETDPSELEGWALLEYYAPVITQEHVTAPAYDPKADYFGAVYLQGDTLDEARPGVDGDQPAIYAYLATRPIQGVMTKQLVYVLWYPEHPPMKSNDPEAGPMEGWTFRITLNPDNRPLAYESVSNCGCYHKIFPTDHLERWSREEHGEPLDGMVFSLEQDVSGIQPAVPETVTSPDGKPRPVHLYYSAGHHQLITVRQTPIAMQGERMESNYQLLPYERLENLPFNGYLASLFGEDGLVREAHRPECDLLKSTGLYHAGHPRQRETQMVNFDEQVFDDPKLLETYLRLPNRAFGRKF